MKRLYQKIYLTIVGSLIAVVLVAGAIWRSGAEDPWGPGFEVSGEILAAMLPPADAPRAEQRDAVARLAERLRLDVTLFDLALHPVASAGRPLPPPDARRPGWM
ncbi:MAG: hypothetical protein HXY30_19325, partial [Pseudorhodoplanes sp.]|nr:hypothetical protein [Pseudorhodoplanes sp.]